MNQEQHLVAVPVAEGLVAVSLADLDQLIGQAGARWKTIEGAAAYSSLSTESIRRMMAAGRLTPYRPRRGRILIDKRELDAAILATAPARRRSFRAKS